MLPSLNQELFEQDERKAANVLKNDVAKVMKQCTMHVQNAQHYFLHQVLLDDLADNRSHLVDPEKVRPLNEKLDQLASEEDYLAAQELVQIAQKQHIDLSRLQEFTSGQQTPFWKKLLLSPFILLGFLNFRLAYIPVDHLIRNTIKDHAFDASIKFLVTVFLFPLSLSLISIVLWVAGVSFNMLLIYWLASFFSLFGFKEWVNSHKQRAHNQKWSEFAANNPDMHTEMIEKLNQLSLLKKKLYT